MAMTETEYVNEDGAQCPYCESYEVYSDSPFESDGGYAWRVVECDVCGKRWDEKYELVGYNEREN